MISLTELARLEELGCSRLEWRMETIWSADCRLRGSSTPEDKNIRMKNTVLMEKMSHLESEVL